MSIRTIGLLTLAGIGWVCRASVVNDGYFPAAPLAVALDLTIGALQYLAIEPMSRANPSIGSARSPSRLLFAATMLAIALAGRDILVALSN